MDSGFGEAELSGNDAHAVALPMEQSNLVNDHSRPAKCFAFLLRSSQPGCNTFSDDIALKLGNSA